MGSYFSDGPKGGELIEGGELYEGGEVMFTMQKIIKSLRKRRKKWPENGKEEY